MYNTDLPNRAELPSSGKLLRSTALAAAIAAGLLATAILPAEYGIDPTGIGRVFGLSQMGEIKVALAAEARAEEIGTAATADANPIQAQQLATTATAVSAAPEAASESTASAKQDTMTVKLKPGHGAEVKLAMSKGDRVHYQWSSAGGPVNYDTHGDPISAPKGFYHGYGKGRNETADTGTLEASFDGKHGWFWRNRSSAEVTVTLKTSGDYTKIERVL